MPKRIQEKPELFFGNALFLNAWFDLDAERDRTKNQKISRSSCFSYADDYEFDLEQKDELWFYISRMDVEFLRWWIQKQPKPRKGKPSGKSRGLRQDHEEAG